MNRSQLQSWHFVVTIIAFSLVTQIVSHKKINDISESDNHELFFPFEGELPDNGYSYLFFYDDDCRLCKKMRHNLEQLYDTDNEDVYYFEVNVADYPEYYTGFRISGIPTVLVCNGYKEMMRIMGVISLDNLKRIKNKIIKK